MAAVSAKGLSGEVRHKSEKAQKAEAVKEIHQLKIKIINLEREKATHLYSKHGEFHKVFTDLEEMDHKQEAQHKAHKAKIIQQVNKIKNMVKKFHRELQNVKPTPEFVEKLKIIMEEIEGHISSFKEQQKKDYEDLMKEERITCQELAALEKRMETWAQQAPPVVSARNKPSAPVASHRDITKDLPPEVSAFERFVQQHGGPRGGWDEYDHGTFMKYRNRHKGKSSFLKEVVGFLPTKTEEEIEHHETWYQEYLALNDRKKEAIAKWKQRKEEEKEAELEAAAAAEEEEEKQREKEEARQKMLERERHERRAHLNAWKVEKELQRAEEEERKLRQEMEKIRKQENEKQKQVLVREQVEAYRQQKEEEEREKLFEKAMKEEEEAEKRRGANFLAAKFQQRDLEKVKDKVARSKAQQEAERERQRRIELSKAKVHVERDPSRLYKMTDAWKERQKVSGPSGGGPMLHMPHRAVPSWRQGLQ